MRRRLNLIILIQLILSLSTWGQETNAPLKVGAINYPPYFEFKKKGAATGIGVDKITELLGPEQKIVWVEVPLNRGDLALSKGHIDLYSAFTRDLNAHPSLSFAQDPYLSLSPQICGHALSPISDDYHELNGKTIISPGPSHMIDRIKGLKVHHMKVSYGDDYISKCMKLIKFDRAQYFFSPTDHFVEQFKKEYPEYKCTGLGPRFDAYLSAKKDGAFVAKLKTLPMRQSKLSTEIKQPKP